MGHFPFEQAPLLSSLPAPIMNTEIPVEHEDMLSFDPGITESSPDPFDNISIALQQWAPSLMRHFTMKMVPDLFHTDLQNTSLHNMRHVEAIHEDMRSCINTPSEMYALLAASACHALSREGELDLPGLSPEASGRVTLLFKSKAFESLRLRLATGQLNRGVVIAIQRMVCAALYNSSHSALESHYRALLSMIQTVGGLDIFNDFQKEQLIMHDFAHALSMGVPPRLELTWDPGELVADVNLEVIFHIDRRTSVTGGRLGTIIQECEGLLAPSVATCASGLIETQQLLEWLRECPYQPVHYRWLAHRRLAIVHRLLTVDGSKLSGISRLVRFALLLYSVMARSIPISNLGLLYHYVTPEIARWDVDAMTEAFKPHDDLLLWAMVTFATGTAKLRGHTAPWYEMESRQSSPQEQDSRRGSADVQGSDTTLLLTKVCKNACQALEISKETQLRHLMKKFLFDDIFADESYMTFAKMGLGLESQGR